MKRLSLIALVLSATALVAGCEEENTGDTTSSSSASSGSGSTSSSSGGEAGGGGAGGGGGGGGAGGASAACSQDMFNKYKAAGFTAVNDLIIAKTVALSAMSPSPIGDTFKPIIADMTKTATFKTNLAAFLIQAYGGPKDYKGKDMVTAHTGLKITQDQYDKFITLAVVPALTEAGVDPKDISDCFAPVVTDPAFVATIVGL